MPVNVPRVRWASVYTGSWHRRMWVPRAPGIRDFLTAATGPPPHGLVVINQTK